MSGPVLYTLDDCHLARGTVVVIDVLRAFTTAAVALHRGASAIRLVGSVDAALALRDAHPDWLTVGEVDGLPIPEFDLPNSPARLADAEVNGRTLIMRTSSGTQGVMRAQAADAVVCASFANISATADYLAQNADAVSFVITGHREHDPAQEDVACAEAIETLLGGGTPDIPALRRQVLGARHAARFADPDQPQYPVQDLEWASRCDWADFAMLVSLDDPPRLTARRISG